MGFDLMVICKEESRAYDAIKIDEVASDGVPVTEFGVWFSERFGPLVSQLSDVSEPVYTRLREADLVSLGYALATMKLSPCVDRSELLTYLWSRVGYHISVDNR